MLKPALTLFSVLFCSYLFGQNSLFTGSEQPNIYPQLERQFTKHHIYAIDVNLLNVYMDQNRSAASVDLRLGNAHHWNMALVENDMRAANYALSIQTANGVEQLPKAKNITYKGYLKGDPESKVRMTIDDELIYGLVESNGQMHFIEPLHYFVAGAPTNQFVVYNAEDVIPNPDQKCGFDEYKKHMLSIDEQLEDEDQPLQNSGRMACLGVELAIALDWSMNQKYGGVNGAAGFASGVMNNVQSNYDNDFNQEIIFQIVETFVVSCSGCDPWTPSTNAGALLNNFRAWGNGGGFSNVGTNFDVGQLWTNRNFNGNTIGVAWVRSVCSSQRYHVLQDFTANASALRVLTAHELGHNFGSGHDSNNSCIMSPTVNTSSCWSAQSRSAINGSLPLFGCLGACVNSQPPIAAFSYNQSGECASATTVQYFDQSLNEPDSWLWQFPGGTPSISTDQNPIVFYNTPGSFGATLEVSNANGTDVATLNNIVFVKGLPTALFSINRNYRTVSFVNLSLDADSYLWEFGDGAFSTLENPEHTYVNDGIYIVNLTAYNECGDHFMQDFAVVITPPEPAFVADVRSGCDEITVSFTNFSTTNAVDFNWIFEGGNPVSSTEQHPVVVYSEPGSFDVSLRVSNAAGVNELIETNYIVVQESPSSAFDYSVNDLTITFTDLSQYADNVRWEFGDGNSSTQRNPVHTYATEDVFTVLMITENSCGIDTAIATLTNRPTIDFVHAQASVTEDDLDGSVDCRAYVELDVELRTSRAISGGDASVLLIANGTAIDPADFEIVNNSLTFPDATNSSQMATVRIFDDAAVESMESVELTFSISGTSNAYPGRQDNFALAIVDNDLTVPVEEQFEQNSRPSGWVKQQGFGTAGWRFETAAALSNSSTTVPGDPQANISGTYDLSVLRTSNFNLSQVVNATLTLDAFYPGLDGSTAEIKVRVGNTDYPLFDLSTSSDWQRNLEIDLSRFIGNSNVRVVFSYVPGGQTAGGYFIDNVSIKTVAGSPEIADAIHIQDDRYLGPYSTVYFHDDSNGELIARIENLSSWDFGCVDISIDRAGSSALPFVENNPQFYISQKNILVVPTHANSQANYAVTMYFTEDEVLGWEAATGNLRQDMRLIRSPGSIKNVTPSNPMANGAVNERGTAEVAAGFYNTHWLVSSEFGNGLGAESGFGAASEINGAPLPVSLQYFRGRHIKAKHHLLEWATASEERSSHFELERSADGRNFTAIHQQEAAGFSSDLQQYSYHDKAPLMGVNYYRLRQVDLDGQFEYSQVITLLNDDDNSNVVIFPNPTDGLVQVQLSNFDESISLKLYNAQGQLVLHREMEQAIGFTEEMLDLSEFADGVYFLRIEHASEIVANQRLVKR